MGGRRARAALRLGVLGLTLGAAALAPAATAVDARSAFEQGSVQAALAAGYAVGFDGFRSDVTDLGDVRMLAAMPSLGVGLSPRFAPGRWYSGSVSVHGEAQLLRSVEPHAGVGGGFGLLMRYQFVSLAASGLVPFVEWGAGVGAIDFDLVDQSDGFSFLLQLGAGLHWFVSERAALTPGWRYHHISNAGARSPNLGINSSLLLLGVTFFPP